MHRLANAMLSVALSVFVAAVSLALIAASWLMSTCILGETHRLLLPKWLIISSLIMAFGQANAQRAAPDPYSIVDAYPRQLNSQEAIPRIITTVSDTLHPTVQTNTRAQKRRISPKPVWTITESSATENSFESDPSSVFYIMAIEPHPSAYKAGYWFRNRP